MIQKQRPRLEHYDILIAGGGAMGSACAYFIASNPAFNGTIAVIEPDAQYRQAASALSASSIRQQFTSPVNIAMSKFGMEFLKAAPERLALRDGNLDISLTESTYLYLATPARLSSMKSRVEGQRNCGVSVQLCTPAELQHRYAWLNVEDLSAGALTTQGEGWFDGYQLLMALRNKARDLGVRYLETRVESLVMANTRQVRSALLADGSEVACDFFVNATGTCARQLSVQAGIDIPVYPRKRCIFVFDAAEPVPNCPLVVDPSGLWFRPEGRRFICGMPPEPDPDVALDDFSVDHGIFEERIWPLLANRVFSFEAIKPGSFWAGHYDYNVFDQNAIIGPHPVVSNFILANGFSGHGLQQAPAVGRGISEQILFGEYRSLDLSALGYDRLSRNEPLLEQNVI